MGRPKGAQNKVTKDFKEALTRLLNAQNLVKLLKHVPAERKLETLAKLAEYVFPKQARTEVTGKDGGLVAWNLTIDLGAKKDP